MNTFVYELTNSVDDRWREVVLLIKSASKEESSDIEMYDALCRATILLIVAHLEGFVKDVAKAIVHDINTFSSFTSSPIALKRTFCKTYLDISEANSKVTEQKRQLLIELLNGLEPKYVVDPFLFEGAYGNNKNPSPGIINKICGNFGVKNIFALINNSKLDAAFSDIQSDVSDLINNLKDHILANTLNYPYTMDLELFDISLLPNGNVKERSFWETFIDQLLKHRNDIAHGATSINSLSVTELHVLYKKVIILEYALIMVLCYKSVPIVE